MSEKATVLVSEAKKVKEGEGDYGPWALYHMIDGDENKWPTFSEPLFDATKALEGKWAEIEWEQNDKGKKYTSIRETTKPENGTGTYTEKLGTGDYIGARKPKSDQRGIACSISVQEAKGYAELEFKMLNPQREWTPALVEESVDRWLERLFIWQLRKLDAIEDRDIPFMPEYAGDGRG